MTYQDLKAFFIDHERTQPNTHLLAHIVFCDKNTKQPTPQNRRTYLIRSTDKLFRPATAWYTIYSCPILQEKIPIMQLGAAVAAENRGGTREVEDCYILEHMRDASAIPQYRRIEQMGGTVSYLFGDTSIQVWETQRKDGSMLLEAVDGGRVICGEWTVLPIAITLGYCTLLERYLNGHFVETQILTELHSQRDKLEKLLGKGTYSKDYQE